MKAKEHKQVPIPSRLNLTPLTRHDFLQVAAAEASRDLQAGSHARVVASVRKKGGYGGSTSSSLRRTRCTEIRGLRSARAPRTFVASSSRPRDSLCLCTAKASQLNGQVVQLYKWVQHSKSCEFHEALMPVMWVCRQNRYIISHFQNGFHTSRPIMTYHILIDTKKYTNTICYHVVLVE